MLIISLDAIGDKEFDLMAQQPAFSALIKQSTVFRDVSTVFLSSTYPVHTSVVTGVTPDVHGIISNTESFPSQFPVWYTNEESIRAKTIWQTASTMGIKTAAVLWPVTAFSKTIRYNIPEVLARPGKSQVMTSLKAGSTFLQINMSLRYGALMDGIRQPNLDNFATACTVDIIRRHNPGLVLVHLSAFDALCHQHGKINTAINEACESLDKNLSLILNAIGDERDVILFSDHAQIDVHTNLDPNGILVDLGLLGKNENGYVPENDCCYIECCGGSAFLHPGSLLPEQIDDLRDKISGTEGFRRFLTDDETQKLGRTGSVIGFCAKNGYGFETFGSKGSKNKASHGYPLDMPEYTVFYMVRGLGFDKGIVKHGGSLLDIAPLVAETYSTGNLRKL